MTLHASAISVKRVLGIKYAAITPGQITLIQGRNGSMKSSFLQAALAALGGGSLARIAHVSKDGKEAQPEVSIVLKGDREYRIEKKGDKTVRVLGRVGDSQAFEDISQPQAFLSSLFDARGCNIVQLLRAPDKDIATLILEALPLELNRTELAAILGEHAKHVRAVPKGLHALEELGAIREDVFTARTGVNRDKDAAKKSADQLRRALPAVLPETHEAEIRETSAKRDALSAEIARREETAKSAETAAVQEAKRTLDVKSEEITGRFKTTAAKLRAAHEQKAAEIRAEAERQIAALKEALDTTINNERLDGDGAIDALEEAFETARDAARIAREATLEETKASRVKLEELGTKLATLQVERDQAQKAQGLVEQVQKFDEQETDLKEQSERMTATLDALDAFRLRLAESLPVPGLEIAGKEVTVNGVPWPQLNKGQRVSILAKVAVFRAKDMPLPLVFVDDAETLDTEHLTLLEEEFAASGVQALLGRVEDTDLEVFADGKPTRVETQEAARV